MALQPELLLLDEPTAYLDPIQTRNLLTELDAIAKLGTTLLIATHDLDFVYQWADWILVMDEGKLIAEGETISVFQQLQFMPSFELGMPSLWQMWSLLSPKMPQVPAPRSIDQFAIALESYLSGK